MILLLNCAFFYSLVSSYFTWFRGVTPEYISYVNSSISSLVVIVAEKMQGPLVACDFLSGFLLYDTVRMLCNKDNSIDNKMYILFLSHHVITFALCNSIYPSMYPDATSSILMVEMTIPVSNLLWFLKFYNIEPLYRTLIKALYFLLYTYYRVYNLTYILINHYYEYSDTPAFYFLLGIIIINVLWYVKIINKLKCLLPNADTVKG